MAKKIVLLLHFFFTLMLFSNPSSWIKPTYQKVHLHFKSSVKPGTPAKATSSIAAVKKTTSNKPTHPQNIKKTTPSKIEPQKQTPRKRVETKKIAKPSSKKPNQTKPATKESQAEQIHKETIAKIFEKIDKLEKITNSEHIATTNFQAQIEASQDVEDTGEISDVIQYLFEILELPGPGKVTLEMFISSEGKVNKIEILQSENPENSQYLISELKDIVLPFHKKGLIPSSLKVCFSNLKP